MVLGIVPLSLLASSAVLLSLLAGASLLAVVLCPAVRRTVFVAVFLAFIAWTIAVLGPSVEYAFQSLDCASRMHRPPLHPQHINRKAGLKGWFETRRLALTIHCKEAAALQFLDQ